ncbi:alpha/beta hydrolase [Sphingomonas sp. LB-2]|uniref:alpha/beta hydrolase n=1 Tax=Sphingomonas caeni TaxID=2984949 RepID=UPI00222F48DC|nr:alpha/beta hydrolase [Sphingomonas caeni]MCW3848384.1 alpha/beta hydrolase [Sphingomonas caeni]
MPIDRRAMLGAALGATALAANAARAQQWGDPPTPAAGDPRAPQWPPAESFTLWPAGRMPNAPATRPTPTATMNGPANARELWLTGVAEPHVGVFRPAKPDGRAVLIIPGGGYRFVSVHNEGIDVAAALTSQGITCFVLVYRLPGEGWTNRADVPLQDAQRAMRLIRAGARTWGINPDKLGMIGFSAGGHLAAMLAVAHSDPVYAAVDAADVQSARPAYAGLGYAVTSFTSAGKEGNTRSGLWGETTDAATMARYNALARVSSDTPASFLIHAMNDTSVPIRQSIAWMEACLAARVPVEVHLLQTGGHGFGGAHLPESSSGRPWPLQFARWTALF